MEIKISLKYSLILFLLTTLLFNVYNLCFNIQDIGEFGLFHLLYKTFFYPIIYIGILIFAYKETIRISEIKFYRILIISFLIILSQLSESLKI